jgi:hypothetical protein
MKHHTSDMGTNTAAPMIPYTDQRTAKFTAGGGSGGALGGKGGAGGSLGGFGGGAGSGAIGGQLQTGHPGAASPSSPSSESCR